MTNWNRDKERPMDLSTRGRLGGLATSSRHSPEEYTAAGLARANSLDKWLEQVPEELPEEERIRRALAMRREHFVRLGLLRGQSRRSKRGGKEG